MTLAFDTLRAARRPRAEGGFDEKQAAILVDTFSERTGETLATKVDLEKTEAALRGQMQDPERRMTIRLGAMMMGAAGLIVALNKDLYLLCAQPTLRRRRCHPRLTSVVIPDMPPAQGRPWSPTGRPSAHPDPPRPTFPGRAFLRRFAR